MAQKKEGATVKPNPTENKISVGQILYNLGYWTTLAQEYYEQINKNLAYGADSSNSGNK